MQLLGISFKRETYQTIVASFLFLLLALGVPLLSVANNQESDRKSSRISHGSINPLIPPLDFDGMVQMSIL
jgi:hypothetical protein